MPGETLPLIDTLAHPDKIFINGRWIEPSTKRRFGIRSSSTEELLFSVTEAQIADMEAAVDAAREAFDTGPWPRMPAAERKPYIEAIGKAVLKRSADLSAIWTHEVGVTKTLADLVMPAMAGVYDYYAMLADSFPFIEQHTPQGGGALGLIVREPVGVIAAISPWNAPFSLMTYKIAPALLAGCTIVLKASPEAPASAYIMAEIVEEAGLPPGVFNMIAADRAVSEQLVRHPDIDKVTFTGSSAAGKMIGGICAERLARCTLELGGKSPAIVLDDYDVAEVAQVMAGVASAMTGQTCSALTRVIVTRRREKELIEAMRAAYASINVGDPFAPGTHMGPLATAIHRDRVETYIASGRAAGAKVVTGGGRPLHLDRGYYVEPTIFARVDNDMQIAREEIFGPVACVIAADNEDHAVELANDSVFGLNASIFTNDVERAYRVARDLRSGTVGHNAFRTDFSIAFGGFKQSGIGREGGVEGLLPFLETKTIILNKPMQLPATASIMPGDSVGARMGSKNSPQTEAISALGPLSPLG